MSGKWLIHGKKIEAPDIEELIGAHFRDLGEFVNLCNSVAWAQRGSTASSIPSFTERYEVAEGGIDAEWNAFEVPAASPLGSPLLVKGWNVFQYKQRNILAKGRKECFTSLKGDVNEAVKKIHNRTRKRPQGFVLFTNLDLTHDTQAERKDGRKLQAWKKELRKALLKDYDKPRNVKVKIVGAAELAGMLNSLPHLRSAYFCRSDFISWDEAWREHSNTAFSERIVQLTGRDHDVKSLEWALENPEVRVVVVSGPDYIGKTRLVLDGTRDRSIDTVMARNPRSLTPGDISGLLIENHLTIVFVPDYEPGKSEDIIRYGIAQKSLKLIVEVSSPDALTLPGFGQDQRVQDLRVRPISIGDSTALLRATNTVFKSGVEEWVLDKASGNPGLLLLAAHNTSELTTRAASFSNAIADSMKKTIRLALGQDRLETLRFLSVFDPISLHQNSAQSIQLIAGTLGISNDRLRYIDDDVDIFRERGLIRGGERFAVVEPCLLANVLVSEIIGRAANPFWDAFVQVSPDIQLSLLRRLRQISGKEIDRFWDRLFGSEGPFAVVDLSVSQLELLLAVVAHVPVTVVGKIVTALENLNPEMRQRHIKGVELQLMWLSEYLLSREEMAETALRCVLLIAQVDDTPENIHPNSRGIFKELFHPLHQQVAIPLQKRRSLLIEYLKPSNPSWLRLLALEAIRTALRHVITYSSHSMPGPVPGPGREAVNFPDVYLYQDQLYSLLIESSQSKDPVISQFACNSIPESIAEIAFAGRGQEAILKFSEALDSVLQNELAIPPAYLGGELARVRGHFLEEMEEDLDKPLRDPVQLWINQIDGMIKHFDEIHDFGTRLKRWAGPWTSADRENVPKGRFRCDTELRKLAEEAATNPDLLTKDLLRWLSSKEAEKAGKFFWLLGTSDAERKWLPAVEAMGRSEDEFKAFSDYFGGWAQMDHTSAAVRLDYLNEAKQVNHRARLSACIYLGPASGGVDRLKQLWIEPPIQSLIRSGPLQLAAWTDEISSEDCLELLELIAGPTRDSPMKALEFLNLWLSSGGRMEGNLLDFAEQCLLAAEPDNGDDYNCDQVAFIIAQQHANRGFNLLGQLLGPSRSSNLWNPIDRHSQARFWNTLRNADKQRAIRVLLTAALTNPEVAWSAREILNQVEDESILVALAKESGN